MQLVALQGIIQLHGLIMVDWTPPPPDQGLFRLPHDPIGLSLMLESESHPGLLIGSGKVRAQGRRRPLLTGGLAEKGVTHCIKDRGLSRASVAGHQEQGAFIKLLKVNHGVLIGAKILQFNF